MNGNVKKRVSVSANDVIELIDNLPQNTSNDLVIKVLLFSMIEGVKMHLNHEDPVRLIVERSDYLNELFINVLETVGSKLVI